MLTLSAIPLCFSGPAFAQAKPKAAPKAAAAKPADKYALLPAGAGRDVEIRVCGQCHTPERPATQRHDVDGWNEIIDMMVQNGATASDEEFDTVVAYLAKAFPPGKK
jgi:mono/diheme cytochrome c family protein